MASQAIRLSADTPTFRVLDKLRIPFCNHEIVARLVHFWEARNIKKGNTLMGFQLLLIDSESTAVQGFIPANRMFRFEDNLKTGSIYKLKKFMVNVCKPFFKVADHKNSLFFTDQTTMVEILDETPAIDHQKFRLRTYNDFADIVDTETNLFDVVEQIRLITGDNLQCPTTTEEAPQVIGNRSKDRIFVHLLMKDGETIRIYLWDKIAARFRERWNTCENRPNVILITTVNPKTIGGVVTLSSTTSSRIFFDKENDETKEFINWLGDGNEHMTIFSTSSSTITKYETVTLKEVYAFVQNEVPQVASFYCYATVTDLSDQEGWYYISCRCKNKLEKYDTSFYCPKCKKTCNIGVTRYRFQITVEDENKDIATFVIFDQDGHNIAGRSAGEFLKSQKQVVADDGSESPVSEMPNSLRSIIGRTCKFHIKVTTYNFGAARQTFSVSRILEDDRQTARIETTNVEHDEVNAEEAFGPTTKTQTDPSKTSELSDGPNQKRLRIST